VVRDYLGVRELAGVSGLSVKTLRRAIADPLAPLPHYRVGAKILVRRSDFEGWMAGRKVSRDNILARVERAAAELQRSLQVRA
jgi:excisionase family DNA binding protein